jgi:hypothetical protein
MSIIVYFNNQILINLKWFISANFLVPKKAVSLYIGMNKIRVGTKKLMSANSSLAR